MTSAIQKKVMRRVYTVYGLRLLASPLVMAPVLFLLSLWGVGREVWVAHVLQNLAVVHTAEGFTAFAVSAFLNTRSVVQMLTLASVFAGTWFVYGIKEKLTTRLSY